MSLLSAPGHPQELSDAAGSSAPSTSSTSASAPSTSSSSSLLVKAKRSISKRKASLKERLPGRLRREPKEETAASVVPGEDSLETAGDGSMDRPRAYTIAPPDHRENTTLHAIMDSLPSLGSLNAPSLFMNLPSFSSKRDIPAVSCFGAEGYEDSDEDDESPSRSRSPRASPPLSTPPMTRRPSDPPTSPSPSSPGFFRKKSPSDDPLDTLYGNVIMMGGYRGSVLREAKSRRRVWIPLKVGFGFRKADLGMGLDDEDELNSEDRIVPGNMLAQVAGLVDLGQRLKTKLKQAQSAQSPSSHSHPSFPFSPPAAPSSPDPLRPPLKFHSFGYDWRRSLELSSKKLLELLEKLKKESVERGEGEDGKGVGATVIAHSMGGLVLLHALAIAPDPTVIRGCIFAGTPFQGCQNVLGAFKLGGATYRNPRVGNPEVVLSWRSSFYFLPRPPATDPVEDGVADETAQEEGEGEKETKAVEPAALPPPVGTPNLCVAPAQLPTPPVTPGASPSPSTPASPRISTDLSSAAPSRQSSRSNSSSSGSGSMQPLPSSTHLTPSTHLPPLSSLLSGCFETPAGDPLPVDFFDPASFSRFALSPPLVGMNLGKERSPRKMSNTGGTTGAARREMVDEARETLKSRKREDEEDEGATLPFAGAPGNLGERPILPVEATSPLDAAASGVEALGRTLDKAAGGGGRDEKEEQGEAALVEEEERLRKQACEEETVRGYLERCLSRAQKFHEDLVNLYDPSKAHLYPPIAVLTSRSTATVRGVLSTSHDTIATEGYERLLWAEGDGIVLYESASRLPGDPEVRGKKRGEGDDKWMGHLKGVVESSHGHVSLLGDLDAVRKCVTMLYG
ncbi:hypothetical protein JCM8097_006847 [Rhodosporidiobolus ruineniae]